ncbi:MAG: ABC transporter permease [Acetobacteraceae bacterium]|nr:ABC transporter permease [Acetobacteraceae bacterium]
MAPGGRERPVPGAGRRLLLRLRNNAGACLGAGMLAVALATAALHPWLMPYDPIAVDLDATFQAPGAAHPFGTDSLGRDVLSRVMAGAPISLRVAGMAVAVGLGLGGPLGLFAGLRGGLADEAVMRLADIVLAFPSFLLAMAITAAMGVGLEKAIFAVGFCFWPRYARLVRGQVLVIREEPYVEAARAMGAGTLRISLRHVLPNCLAPVLVQATMDSGFAILATAGLSFLGLGASPPTPEWGAMIAEYRQYLVSQWWMPVFPGLALSWLTAGFVFLGDGLRDILDPRLRAGGGL